MEDSEPASTAGAISYVMLTGDTLEYACVAIEVVVQGQVVLRTDKHWCLRKQFDVRTVTTSSK